MVTKRQADKKTDRQTPKKYTEPSCCVLFPVLKDLYRGQISLLLSMTGPTHLSCHLNLTSYLILSICIWINSTNNLRLPLSVCMTYRSLFLCLYLKCSFLSFLKLSSHSFLYHAALLRRLINHSGGPAVTPSVHTAVVSAAHIFTLHNSAGFTRGS